MNRPLFSIVFLAGATLTAFLFTWPSLRDFQFLQEEKRSKATEFENREEYFANLTSLQTQFKNFEPELRKLDYALPQDSSLPSLYQLLQEIASGSGVVLKAISAQVAKGDTAPKAIDLQVTVAGPYESLKQFLESSQNAWRLLFIDSVSFVSPKTGSSFEVSFRMQAYSY
jgi:Tfp pilus assembly protein PilO